MSVKLLLPENPVTKDGKAPSDDLIEIIQRLVVKLTELEARIEVLEP